MKVWNKMVIGFMLLITFFNQNIEGGEGLQGTIAQMLQSFGLETPSA